MFNLENVEKHSKDLIQYRGHLPYYIMAVLGIENIRKRNEYLKGISETTYNDEVTLLKSERRNNTLKLESLQQFLKDNPKFHDLIQSQHLKPLLK